MIFIWAMGCTMPIKIDVQLPFTADQVWVVLGTPDRVDWVPGVESCSLKDGVRSLVLPGAGAIKERILNLDNSIKKIEYSCFESPGPLESHYSSIQVLEAKEGCRLLWEASVEPVAIETFVRASMQGALAQLKRILTLGD